MKKSSAEESPLSWPACPNHIIIKIGCYVNPKMTYKMRLINNHWLNSVNRLVFYSNLQIPEDKMDYFMEKYSYHIKFWDNCNFTDSYLLKYKNKVNYLDEIEWKVLDDKIERFLTILQRYNMPKTLWLVFTGETFIDIVKLTEFFSMLATLSKLKELYLCAYFVDIRPCLNILPILNLKRLTLKCDSKYVQAVLDCYKSLIQLEEFNIYVENMQYTEFPSKSIIPRPSLLLGSNKLKHLKMVIYDSIANDELRTNLANEISNIYSSKNFSNLNSFIFLIILFENRLPETIFDLKVERNLSNPFSNLARLVFSVIDRYFLTFIIENFPNLIELVTYSPLVCPFHSNLSALKPHKSLKKLLVGGFHMELHSKHYHISRLLPNVVTLNCFESDLNSLTISRDAALIPLCFPNLTKLILGSSEYILKNLLKLDIDFKWEELYLTIDHIQFYQYQQLISFNLPNLNIIYADKPTINLYKVAKNSKTILYKANMHKFVGFDIDIIGPTNFSNWALLKSKLKLIVSSKMSLNR